MDVLTLDVLECKDTQSIELGPVGGDREIEGDACPGTDCATIRGWSTVPQTFQLMTLATR